MSFPNFEHMDDKIQEEQDKDKTTKKYQVGDKCFVQDKDKNYISGIFVGITNKENQGKDKIVICHRNGNEFYLRKYPYQINKDDFDE